MGNLPSKLLSYLTGPPPAAPKLTPPPSHDSSTIELADLTLPPPMLSPSAGLMRTHTAPPLVRRKYHKRKQLSRAEIDYQLVVEAIKDPSLW